MGISSERADVNTIRRFRIVVGIGANDYLALQSLISLKKYDTDGEPYGRGIQLEYSIQIKLTVSDYTASQLLVNDP